MPAVVFDEHDPLFDPDELKMPESPAHRRTIDVIALAASRLLGPEHRVFRDMNWYPTDGGTAIAPDLFVLPADALPLPPGAVASWPKSYRQDQSSGPSPSVVVEVPSDSDGFASLRSKVGRCRRLGATVYLVVVTASPPEVLRLEADGEAEERWTDRPIPELGGLRIGFDEDALTVTTPDGLRATSDEDLTHQLDSRAAEAEGRAAEAESRAERLAARLRELGIESDETETGPA
jgi:hypothetical protein